MSTSILNIADVFKIAGLAGVVTFFFFLIVKQVVKNLGDITRGQRVGVMLVILVMAFSLSLFGMYIYFTSQLTKDGGEVNSLIQKASSLYRNVNHQKQQDCSNILLGTFELWMSFNEDRPYYRTHEQEKKLRVILQSVSETHARFVINTPTGLIAALQLRVGESHVFKLDGCSCTFTFLGERQENAGFQYLFRTRHIAKYKLEAE